MRNGVFEMKVPTKFRLKKEHLDDNDLAVICRCKGSTNLMLSQTEVSVSLDYAFVAVYMSIGRITSINYNNKL